MHAPTGHLHARVWSARGVPSMYVCGRTARDVRKAVAALDGSARALGFDLLLLGRSGWAQSRDLETARPQDIPETMLRGVFGGWSAVRPAVRPSGSASRRTTQNPPSWSPNRCRLMPFGSGNSARRAVGVFDTDPERSSFTRRRSGRQRPAQLPYRHASLGELRGAGGPTASRTTNACTKARRERRTHRGVTHQWDGRSATEVDGITPGPYDVMAASCANTSAPARLERLRPPPTRNVARLETRSARRCAQPSAASPRWTGR
jgi:hypothetical protein